VSSPGTVFGWQRPRIRFGPKCVRNDVDDAVFLAGSYGLVADEWQRLVVRAWLGYGKNGKFSATRCGLSVPRQNGKNACLEIRELFGMVALGERILHTAHEVKTERKAFLRLASFFENPRKFPELAALVVAIRKTNGQEAIILTNGGSVEFVARSKGSARGFSVDLLVLDEAQDLSEEAFAALKPTISASANPQTIMTGTPPGPTSNGEIFAKARADGIEGKGKRQSWIEWSPEDDADLDDSLTWAATNPAFNTRLAQDTVEDERADTPSDEIFARERLGRWSGKVRKPPVIDILAWNVLADQEIEPVPGGVLAWDVAPMGLGCAISYAWFNEDGKPCVKLMAADSERANELPFVRDQLKGLWSPKIEAYDVYSAAWGGGNYAALTLAQKRKVWQTGAREMVQACAGLLQGIASQEFRHAGQSRLDDSAGSATKRDVGADGGWAFNRRNMDYELPPIVSATLALYVLKKSKKQTAGKPRIIVLT
jgi:hypothetical protein